MLHIQAKVQVKPDLVAEFLVEVNLVIQGSLSETGNHGYELVCSVENANIFYILESGLMNQQFSSITGQSIINFSKRMSPLF